MVSCHIVVSWSSRTAFLQFWGQAKTIQNPSQVGFYVYWKIWVPSEKHQGPKSQDSRVKTTCVTTTGL